MPLLIQSADQEPDQRALFSAKNLGRRYPSMCFALNIDQVNVQRKKRAAYFTVQLYKSAYCLETIFI